VDQYSYRTVYANKTTAEKNWVLVDAQDQVLGRLASQVARVLRGKNKTTYTPNTDMGDHVVVINAEKVRMTGKKFNNRVIFTYSGYPGGQRFATPKHLLGTKPADVLSHAIHGMLPKNRLGRRLNTNIFIYAGKEHKHEAQQPKKIDLNTVKA